MKDNQKKKKARQAEIPKRQSRQKKPAMLKAQKGGLGKSQGQRKEEEEKKNWKILPSWKLEDAT